MKKKKKAPPARRGGRTVSRHDFYLADLSGRFRARQRGEWAGGMWSGDILRIEDPRERASAFREQHLPRCPLPGERVKILGTRKTGVVVSHPRVLESDPDTGTPIQEVLVRWNRPRAGMEEYWMPCRSLVRQRGRRGA